ncbi:anther-specific proline-rich protein APG-like [Nilaparvata lugens]|uniref:anther-specific proline-rich protein APG-like n=1 Tax=Nilaparvata lugens TaxID=108931 RepID=UPI00193CCA13|nr:anther-specific proline-rich protein APG-like [Nilaparvata lugens]
MLLFTKLEELLDMEPSSMVASPPPASLPPAAPSPLLAALPPATLEALLEMLVVAVNVDNDMLAEINSVGLEEWLRRQAAPTASPPPMPAPAASPPLMPAPAASPPQMPAPAAFPPPMLAPAASPPLMPAPAASPPLMPAPAASPPLMPAPAAPLTLLEGDGDEEEARFGVGEFHRLGLPIQRGVERESGYGRGWPSHVMLNRQRRRVVCRLRMIVPFPTTPARYMGCQEILSRIFNRTR